MKEGPATPTSASGRSPGGAAPAEPGGQGGADGRVVGRMVLLAGMFFFIFSGAGAQQAYLVQYLERAAGWSGLRAGCVMASVYLAMLVFRTANVYLFPGWSDRRYTIVGGGTYLLFTLAMLATGLVKSLALALAAACVWGAGGAMMWTGTTMQTLALADRAGGRHGRGMGLLYSSTQAGWTAGVIVLGIAYRRLAVERLYVLYALAAGLTLMGNVLALLLPATGRAARDRLAPAQLWAMVTRPRAVVAGVLQLASALAFGLVVGAMGKYVQDTHGAKWVWVSLVFFPATRMALSFVSGVLTDRLGQAAVLFGGFSAAAAGLAVAVAWTSPAGMIVATFTLGLLSGTVPVAAASMVGAAAERRRRPLAYGVLFSWGDLGIAAAVIGVRVLGLTFNLATALTVFIAVFAACAVLSLLLLRYARQRL